MLIHPCHALTGVIADTEKDEYKYNFIFLLGAGISDWNSNSSALYFSGFIHAYAIGFIK